MMAVIRVDMTALDQSSQPLARWTALTSRQQICPALRSHKFDLKHKVSLWARWDMTTLLQHGPFWSDSRFLNPTARLFHPSHPVSPCVRLQHCFGFVANANIACLIYCTLRFLCVKNIYNSCPSWFAYWVNGGFYFPHGQNLRGVKVKLGLFVVQ